MDYYKEANDRVKRMTKLLKCFQSIENFNDVIGNPHSYEGVYNQLLRVQEEVEESLDAVSETTPEFVWIDDDFVQLKRLSGRQLKKDINQLELLDGICDILVTSLGLIKKAEALGYDVFGALEAVCRNNESKYCKSEEHAIETHQYYLEKGIETYREWSEAGYCWVVKRTSDNKLLKCKGFQSVELSEFLPKQ